MELLQRVKADLDEYGVVEQEPKIGRTHDGDGHGPEETQVT